MPIRELTIQRPIFLVGTMRSGTTLLAEMLGESPYIAHCPFELKDVWSQGGDIRMASAKTRDTLCPERFASDMRAGQREALTAIFLQRMAACGAKAEGAAFLNKNPHLCNKLPLVNALFPDARFVWIFRDLPQVVASVKRLFADVCQRQQAWHWWPYPSETTRNRCWNAFHSLDARRDISPARIFPGGDIRFIAEYWLESNRAVSDFVNRLPPGRCIRVAEEAVLVDPIKELATITAKLEVPFIERDQVGGAVDRSRNDLWPGLLDESEIEILADFIDRHAEEIDGIFALDGHTSRYLATLRDASSRQ